MSSSSPIYTIAKELNIDSNRILLACKTLGIRAKGATRKLNQQEYEKVKSYFETGKNASQEIIDLNESTINPKIKSKRSEKKTTIDFFPNRLIGKS